MYEWKVGMLSIMLKTILQHQQEKKKKNPYKTKNASSFSALCQLEAQIYLYTEQ